MNKPILFAMLAIAGTVISVSDVEARCCRRSCCTAAACGCGATQSTCSSGCGTAQAVTTSEAIANNNAASSSYQSYSYEPGSSQTAAVVPVQANVRSTRQSTWSEYDNVLRGNRKVVNTPY